MANREARDQLILNYDAQVAQARSGMSALQRNGWGLVSSLDGASQEVEIYDALGTSAAAGSRWSTSLNKMFSALCERCETIALLFATYSTLTGLLRQGLDHPARPRGHPHQRAEGFAA